MNDMRGTHRVAAVFGQPGWSGAWRRPEGGASGGTEAGLAKHGRDLVGPFTLLTSSSSPSFAEIGRTPRRSR